MRRRNLHPPPAGAHHITVAAGRKGCAKIFASRRRSPGSGLERFLVKWMTLYSRVGSVWMVDSGSRARTSSTSSTDPTMV